MEIFNKTFVFVIGGLLIRANVMSIKAAMQNMYSDLPEM
jgi:hypothetical protein